MSNRLTSFTRAGLRFDVVDSGPIDGNVVLALHGFPQTASSLSELTGLLNARGYRTIAPNQRGYSPGARPRGRFAYRVSELVGDVVALIREIDRGPVHLVGHDWGAVVAWSLAGARPDLVRTLVTVSVPHPGAYVRGRGGREKKTPPVKNGRCEKPGGPPRGSQPPPHPIGHGLSRT
ncbi:alpha/beta fold hydrolase, partial [Nocardia sp. NPDC058497]|uniref:alpha/beta fold hydrolase n=1 Tax=Nocardia sp. NPDC058497 TaxID=3346529 RepID=UPI003646165A